MAVKRVLTFLAYVLLALLMPCAEGLLGQAFPVLAVDTLVRDRLAIEWQQDNPFQHERGYCVLYATLERTMPDGTPVVIYWITDIERADEADESATGGGLECRQPHPNQTLLHTHPPGLCPDHDEGRHCILRHPFGQQCFASPIDMRELNRSDQPFWLLQCDKYAIVPIWRTAPYPRKREPTSPAQYPLNPIRATVLDSALGDLAVHVQIEARPTHAPPVLVRPEVGACKQVSGGAVGLPGVPRAGIVATQNIDARRDSLNVRGIEAGPIPTQVIGFEADRDGTLRNFIGKGVNLPEAHGTVEYRTRSHISARRNLAGPNPAIVWPISEPAHPFAERSWLRSHALRTPQPSLRSIQCDRYALVPVWRTAPYPPTKPSADSHR